MKRMLKRFGLYRRMILSFCSVSLLSSLLVIAVTCIAMDISHRSSLKRLLSDTIVLACSRISTQLSVTGKLCDNLSRNVNMQAYLQMEFSDLSEQYSTDLFGSSELMSMASADPKLHGLYVFGVNGGEYKSNILSFKSEDFQTSKWFHSMMESTAPLWLYSSDGSLVVKSTEDSFLYVGYPFLDKASGACIGVILAELSVDEVFSVLGDEFEPYCQIGLYSLQGTEPGAIVSGGQDLTETVLRLLEPEDTSAAAFYSETHDIIVGMQIPPSPWTIVGNVQASEIRPYTKATLCGLAAALSAIIAVSILCAVRLSRSIARPIRRLAEQMECAQNGDFSMSVTAERADEIGQLTNNFNHLLAKIRSLIDRIYRDQEELRQAELSAMQAQINPHFLYNSLDSTIWLLKMNQVPKAVEMLQSLSALFRISLSKGRRIIPLSQELTHVRSYLQIQHLRYSEKFDYDITVDTDALECGIVKVVLQPIVENSIYHGICEAHKLHITIHVRLLDKTVQIAVTDDGAGIGRDELAELQVQLAHPHETPETGYGLHNANARIKLYYGQEYGIELQSALGKGTTVLLTIPRQT